MACDGKVEGGLWLLPWVEGGGAVAGVVAMVMSLLVVEVGEGPGCNGGEHGDGAVSPLDRMMAAHDSEGRMAAAAAGEGRLASFFL